MSDEPRRNIALLIDADNASAAGIDPVLTVLAELGAINIRRAYGNWTKPALKGWVALLHGYAIAPMQQFDLTKGKNATDMSMTIDALDLLHAGRADGFGIMSSDSDFTPLVMRIRQDGVPVYGFGQSKTPEAFRAACTRFIDVDALVREESEPEPAPEGATEAPLDPDDRTQVVALLAKAWKAAKRDEKGFADLSEVGNLAGNRSSFDVRNYGYKRLSDLVAALPNFQTERRENGRLYVKRLR